MSMYLLLFPIGALLFLIKFRTLLRSESYEARFGSLYLDMKVDNHYAYLQTVFFLLRRVFLAGSIVFGGDVPFLQAFINIGISFFLLLYLIIVKPFLSNDAIYYEVYNEVTVLMISYLQMPLIDIVTD